MVDKRTEYVADTLIVTAGQSLYGLPVRDVIEIVDQATITPVPGVTSGVRGVTRYGRGVVAVVPLATLVSDSAESSPQGVSVVVVQSGTQIVAIEVDDVIDVVATGPGGDATTSTGTGRIEYEGDRVSLVDIQSVSARLEQVETSLT